MNQEERLNVLIQYLIQEDPSLSKLSIPDDMHTKKRLYRSLCNIRKPKPLSQDFLELQDAYLQEEQSHETIISWKDLKPMRKHTYLWQGDITTLQVDAIVNAANSALLGCFIPEHSCIDNIIHTKSGNQLRWTCHQLMEVQGYPESVGKAKITPGFNLPCRYILHTVGPMIRDRVREQDKENLASCYRSCMELAIENGCRSIAFCAISTGEFHFPHDLACHIAVHTIEQYRKEHSCDLNVIFNVFKDIDYELYKKELAQ